MSSAANTAYKSLATEDESFDQDQDKGPTPGSRIVSVAVFCGAVASPLLLLVLVIRSFTLSSQNAAFPDVRSPKLQAHFLDPEPWDYDSYSPCGHSIESARNAGCKWSAMSFAWTPPECYDDEVELQFLNVHNWTWYSTEELLPGTELDRDAVIRGDEPNAAMDSFFHNVHCIFTLKKIQRSLLGIALSDNYMLRWDHAKHCEMYLMEDYQELHSGGHIHSEIVTGKVRYLDCVVTG